MKNKPKPIETKTTKKGKKNLFQIRKGDLKLVSGGTGKNSVP